MQEPLLERPKASGPADTSAAKQPWESPHLDVLPLAETRAALGGGLDGALAGTMS